MPENSITEEESNGHQLGRKEGLWNVEIHQAPGIGYVTYPSDVLIRVGSALPFRRVCSERRKDCGILSMCPEWEELACVTIPE